MYETHRLPMVQIMARKSSYEVVSRSRILVKGGAVLDWIPFEFTLHRTSSTCLRKEDLRENRQLDMEDDNHLLIAEGSNRNTSEKRT